MKKPQALEILAELEALWEGKPSIMGAIARQAYVFDTSGVRFATSPVSTVSGKFEIVEKNSAGQADVAMERSFKAHAGRRAALAGVDLGPNDLGRVFQYGGMQYKVVGWNHKAPKYPVVVRYAHTASGTTHRFPLSYMPRPGAFVDNGIIRGSDGTSGGFSAWVDAVQPNAIAPDGTYYRQETDEEGPSKLSFDAVRAALLAAFD